MPFATFPRLFHSRLLAVLVVFAALVSSCQSSRPSYSFQPAPGRARAVVVAPAVSAVAQDSALEAQMPVVAAHSVQERVALRARTINAPKPVQHTPQAGTEDTQVAPAPVAAVHRRPLLRRPHATAESGLGVTVLGVLGLIALPIAIIGLILSGGGLGWIIVGGLAAVAVLIAYIDPDKR